MLRFNNDYNRTCHEEILKALQNSADESYCGYGLDEICDKAKNEIKKYLDCENADIHFLVGGTQTNFTVISSLLKPFESVLCADTGHINVHETGAVENTGHKVSALPSDLGKITAEQVEKEAVLKRIKDGEVVSTVNVIPNTELHLEVKVSKPLLKEQDTYDMAAIRVRILDEHGNPAPYAQLPVKFTVDGPLELVGPDVATAEGGMCGTYVKTNFHKGGVKLTISCHGLDSVTVDFVVK